MGSGQKAVAMDQEAYRHRCKKYNENMQSLYSDHYHLLEKREWNDEYIDDYKKLCEEFNESMEEKSHTYLRYYNGHHKSLWHRKRSYPRTISSIELIV